MIRVFLIVLSIFSVFSPLQAKKNKDNDEPLKVMSYNIRMATGKDGTNSWDFRCIASALMIQDQMPDVMGLQEALPPQMYFLKENFLDYGSVGVGRDNGKKKGEVMAIFWNKKTVSMLKWGTFWLSETPDKPSKGWDAACYRTATWALMRCKKTGEKFYFVNTHLDHKGTKAQKEGLKLILEKIKKINTKDYPLVLTGDFNIRPNNPILNDLNSIMQCTREVAEKTDKRGTFNGWGSARKDVLIDYIYMSGFSKCTEYKVVTEKYDNRAYVSDHYPIYAKLIF